MNNDINQRLKTVFSLINLTTRYDLKITKVILIIICCSIFIHNSNGQTSSILPEIIPSSPVVSNLGVFGEIPVRLNTGIPSISIPIYTLTEGDITVPISLDYHASGVKIKDRSGLVGVKWALNAGGQIKVNYKAPVGEPRGYITRDELMGLTLEEEWNYFLYAEGAKVTFKPDSYAYTLPERSGSFYVYGKSFGTDSENIVQHVPKNDYIKITNVPSIIGNEVKTITDEKGIKYSFEQYERTFITYQLAYNQPATLNFPTGTIFPNGFPTVANIDDYRSAYFLDLIESPSGKSVQFIYENNTITYADDLLTQWAYVTNIGANQGTMGVEPTEHKASISTYESKRIKQIIGENAVITFIYDEQVDLLNNNDGGGQLKEIIIGNKSKTIKKYKIHYMYNGRYNIDRVDIFDGVGNKVSDYQITYVDGQVPEPNTTGVDFYGYNNGKSFSNGSNIIPTLELDGSVYPGADRRVDTIYSKIGIIESLKYPTGGRTIFEFEANKSLNDIPASSEPGEKISGGHRIKQVTNFDHDNNQIFQKKYTYELASESLPFSSRYFDREDVMYKWIQDNGPYTNPNPNSNLNPNPSDMWGDFERVSRSSSPIRSGDVLSHPGYKYVNEIEEGNGYIRYEFTCNVDEYSWVYDYAPLTSLQYKRGRLKNKWVYAEGNPNPLRHEEYTYLDEELPDEYIHAMLYRQENTYGGYQYNMDFFKYGTPVFYFGSFVYSGGSAEARHGYSYSFYTLSSNYTDLKSQSVTEFTDNGSIISTKIYEYNDDFNLLSKTTSTGSNNDNIELIYKYPSEYAYTPGSVIEQMAEQKNMIGVPIETTQLVNGEVVKASATKFTYDASNDLVLPDQFYAYEATSPGSGFSPSTDGQTFTAYQPKGKILSHDDKGNALSQQLENNVIVSYIWGYNQTLPIAKIENATYAQLEVAVSTTDLNLLKGNTLTDQQIRDKIELLRNHPIMTYAIITNYTYDPLTGMTSQTDPNGKTVYYEYDDFGRLQHVKDNEGNVLTKTEYHYKGQ